MRYVLTFALGTFLGIFCTIGDDFLSLNQKLDNALKVTHSEQVNYALGIKLPVKAWQVSEQQYKHKLGGRK